jgi:hypothetical protein
MIAGEWLLESGVDNTVVVVFTDLMWEYLFPVFFSKILPAACPASPAPKQVDQLSISPFCHNGHYQYRD